MKYFGMIVQLQFFQTQGQLGYQISQWIHLVNTLDEKRFVQRVFDSVEQDIEVFLKKNGWRYG